MKNVYASLGALVALIHQTQANNDIITLNADGSAYITEAVATLVLPTVPSSNSGDLAFWSAIMMENGDGVFLQGVTQNSPASMSNCESIDDDWCNFAYSLSGSTPTPGTAVLANAGAKVKTHYKLNPSTNVWDQDLYLNGDLVSSVSSGSGEHGTQFYVSIECASTESCAEAPAHQWEDISVVLSEADESFKHTGSWAYSATGGVMSTSDSGKTWNFTTLSIPAMSVAHTS